MVMPVWAGYLVGALIALIPTMLALLASAALSKRSQEEWKLLAWVPPAPVVLCWIWLIVGMVRDPTSANLWPFVMLAMCAFTAVLFGVFLLGRRFLARKPGASPWQR